MIASVQTIRGGIVAPYRSAMTAIGGTVAAMATMIIELIRAPQTKAAPVPDPVTLVIAMLVAQCFVITLSVVRRRCRPSDRCVGDIDDTGAVI